MKITEISLTIEPNDLDLKAGRITTILFKSSDEKWRTNHDGMFPYEAELIAEIQEKIIEKFNWSK